MPYTGKATSEWSQITKGLIKEHPLMRKPKEIVEVTLKCWEDIFSSKFGTKPFQIGKDIFPKPQIMGFLLHELIPLEFAERYKDVWRPEKNADDKDLVCITDSKYSVEIKTSSSKGKIFGNRSYSQETQSDKKSKCGYYLAINFEKFVGSKRPEITLIRFGWLDHSDWRGQAAASGQQASLSADVDAYKLIKLY